MEREWPETMNFLSSITVYLGYICYQVSPNSGYPSISPHFCGSGGQLCPFLSYIFNNKTIEKITFNEHVSNWQYCIKLPVLEKM